MYRLVITIEDIRPQTEVVVQYLIVVGCSITESGD